MFYIQKQTTINCSKHFHIRDQACPVWIKLIYNIHTALNNITPKIKYLSTNKAYFLSIIPFCLTISMLLMSLLLKILNSSYVLSGALEWVWKWMSTKMTIIRVLGSHQNFRVLEKMLKENLWLWVYMTTRNAVYYVHRMAQPFPPQYL